MGYMQVYRVGDSKGDSPLGKISRLLNGEGIDCEELGNQRPDTGCILIDLTAGEDVVRSVSASVPQLPSILVASSQAIGERQLGITDEFVSSDQNSQEIIRRVQCLQNLSLRITEEVPKPEHTRVLLDGETEGDEANLKDLAGILSEAGIEWEKLKEESDKEGTGIVYSHYRRASYARLLQGDYPGYMHIHMAQTPELRVEALTVGDYSYTPKNDAEEIVTRHNRFSHMLERLRNPSEYHQESAEHSAAKVFFIGDRNTGTTLRNRFSEAINLEATASTAGAVAQASKFDVVLIHLGGQDDAKERFAFLQMLLKREDHPPLALLFLKAPPDRIRGFCEKQGVALIESTNAEEVEAELLKLKG